MSQTSAYMARTNRFIQKIDAFMDRTEMKLQNEDATLKSLETQVGQISQILNTRLVGGFPSDNEVPKGATHEQCKAISTRSGKVLEPTNKQRGTTAAHTNTSAVTDNPAKVDIPSEADEDPINPTETREVGSTIETSQPEQTRSEKLEEIRPPPPFPKRLKKQKQDYQFKKFFDILKQTKGNASASNINSLEATMQEFISTTKTMLQEHYASIKHQGNMLQTQGALLQSHSSSLRALETQVGQIAQSLHVRPHGNLPSNTEVTKSNGKEQCSALTLRSGKEINKEDKFGGKSVEDPTPSHVQKEPEFLDYSPIEEDKGEKLDNEKTKKRYATAASSATPQPVRDEVRPPPTFPQRLKKHKEDLQFQKFVSMLDQFHINIPFLEAIDQIPSYAKILKDIITKKRKVDSYETVDVASEYCVGRIDLPMKKKDPENFIIPCSIGNNFMGNALCDLGLSVILMPKAVFKNIGIGIERPTIVILQLADRSYV
ncbi:hypothetical protein GQ457_15G015910 [Hibiscus cannabinus]